MRQLSSSTLQWIAITIVKLTPKVLEDVSAAEAGGRAALGRGFVNKAAVVELSAHLKLSALVFILPGKFVSFADSECGTRALYRL